jgi:recombination protein RecA
VKNKLAPPFKEAEFDLIYGEGISREGDIVDIGSDLGVIEKSGTWYSYGDVRIGQGKENAKEFLKQHPEVAAEVEQKILIHYGLKKE